MKALMKMVLIYILKQWRINNIILEFLKIFNLLLLFINYILNILNQNQKKIATYVSNGNKICIYNTIEENELKEGNIIVIINKFD